MGVMSTHKEERAEDKARSAITNACRKFFIKLGKHATDPLLFQYISEMAVKEFNLKLDGPGDATDFCFLRRPDHETFHKLKAENRRRRRAKRKYEELPPELTAQHTESR